MGEGFSSLLAPPRESPHKPSCCPGNGSGAEGLQSQLLQIYGGKWPRGLGQFIAHKRIPTCPLKCLILVPTPGHVHTSGEESGLPR